MLVCAGCHEMIQVAELSYDLDYVILFWSWMLSTFHGNIIISWKYPRSVDILRILWMYLYSVDILHFLWKYPCFVDIIPKLWKYPRSVDIIRIAHNKSYLCRNIFHGLHSFVLVMDTIYIGHTKSYLASYVNSLFHMN